MPLYNALTTGGEIQLLLFDIDHLSNPGAGVYNIATLISLLRDNLQDRNRSNFAIGSLASCDTGILLYQNSFVFPPIPSGCNEVADNPVNHIQAPPEMSAARPINTLVCIFPDCDDSFDSKDSRANHHIFHLPGKLLEKIGKSSVYCPLCKQVLTGLLPVVLSHIAQRCPHRKRK